ncbi:MAG: hypothetical protein HC894_12200 [Microcoleus sp. SM1_3_4]|nr:hypothetical protein [Microcoleus sp. SM1_3_4]
MQIPTTIGEPAPCILKELVIDRTDNWAIELSTVNCQLLGMYLTASGFCSGSI